MRNVLLINSVPISMKKFGSLSFGHYSGRATDGNGYTARNALQEAVDLAKAADDLGVNGAYLRVHHSRKPHSVIVRHGNGNEESRSGHWHH